MSENQRVMRKIRDQLLAILEEHEALEHDGGPCITERLSMVAYVCHTLGIKPVHFPDLVKVIGEYDERCPCAESRRLTAERN